MVQNRIAGHSIHAGQPSMKINILTTDIGGTITTDGLTRAILSKFPLGLILERFDRNESRFGIPKSVEV
ncbi:hypothetical protein HOC_18329 [Hyphomonas oceanitis SCH89]|uniref:Uncharacterized protein n=2 Tax=Hyphomonadales TaxID=2800060 RepID=A0A059G1Y6_9PROT|nr:hypothetical protein HOC_18329 [Hyphomonas oceanitis SCH89]RIJ16631.1 hypothetical protein D1231_07365 [Henriciella mobilis]